MKHRSVVHYGYKFLYGSNNIDKAKPMQEGIPEICGDLIKKMLDMGVMNEYPDQLTVNQYQPGQGTGLNWPNAEFAILPIKKANSCENLY